MNANDATPEAAFAHAQAAVADGDLATVFGCLDRADLLKIADNSVRALSTADPEFGEVCDRFGFDRLGEMQELTTRMAASAALLTTDPAAFDSGAHQQTVKDYQAAVTTGLRSVDDLPRFVAAMEDRMRTVVGGGSISSSLFQGETLTDLVIDGKKAWATRVEAGSEIDDIGFVEKRDGWKIKLFARRPAR